MTAPETGDRVLVVGHQDHEGRDEHGRYGKVVHTVTDESGATHILVVLGAITGPIDFGAGELEVVTV